MNATSSERRIALSGPAAAEWLKLRGWVFEAGGAPSQIYADEVRTADFVTRRLWISVVAGNWGSPHPAIMQLTLIVEGNLEVDIGYRGTRLSGGHGIRRTGSQELSFSSEGPIAIMQIETLDIPGVFALPDEDEQVVFEAQPALRDMLIGQISSTLNSDIDPLAEEFAYLKRSIEYATMALLIGSARKGNNNGSSSERRVYRSAVNLITTRAADPRISLDDIANELNVSRSYLQRAFRGTGSTPLGFLHRTRVYLARDLLQGKHVTERDELDAIARQAGFSSARVMKDALRRDKAATEDRQ